ncbi:MAG TPA: DUF4910 domain-containing protein [Burkholderiaceae bacterium]|nr:DUF4910 domain-containing protein [Burkholderiaceae bacterium]
MTETAADTGQALHALCRQLYPIARSITGDGVRATLAQLSELIPLQIHEVPSGEAVFDWVVPPEWNVRAAWLADAEGRRIVDLAQHTLHVVNYSEPVRARLTLEQLQPHLHSIPEHPDWIPYRTSYYQRTWGFCLSHRQRQALRPGTYEAVIDSTLAPGHLTYGECCIEGASDRELIVSVHVCHPSLANDNLSGISVATLLARELAQTRPNHTIRFLFVPSTIGAITWLARNRERLDRIDGGLVLSGVGDAGGFTYKRSRRGGAIDRIVAQVLAARGEPHTIEPFGPYGYDERQFCSPGIDLPVGCLMRTPYGCYPQYHTSADDLDFIRPESLAATLAVCRDVLARADLVATWRNLQPFGEPQLGRRGLYDSIGGENDKKTAQMALLWMLSYSDGEHSTLDISELSGLPLDVLHRAAGRLRDADLLAPTDRPAARDPAQR